MDKTMIVQGRRIDGQDLELIQQLLAQNPDWSRQRLSRQLCELWDWRTAAGQLKDMAARALVRKLDQRGYVRLPPSRGRFPNRMRDKKVVRMVHDTNPIQTSLAQLAPLQIRELSLWPQDMPVFESLLSQYHYLGYISTVGQNLKYLALDRHGRPLGCVLFGAAAWKCTARDRFIGWTAAARQKNLCLIANNSRLLILPWVRVRGLASHLLSQIARRIRSDWQRKYGHPVALLESFVDTERFRGACYRAANWIYTGQTTGRTRQDRFKQLQVSVKAVYLYRNFQEFLIAE